jgi:glucokinase
MLKGYRLAAAAAGLLVASLSAYMWHRGRYKEEFLLVGDIGGTNLRLRLVKVFSRRGLVHSRVKESFMKTSEYDTLEEAIRLFLKDQPPVKIAVLAIAGPIINQTVIMANVPKWGQLKASEMGRNLGCEVCFLNDFEAISYGI